MITPEGDYLSDPNARDLRSHFKHLHWRAMGHSQGHLVASDWADKSDDDPVFGIYKKCGLWTRDEASVLYKTAAAVPSGDWLDIGCHTGWTSWHIQRANNHYVHYCDPCEMLFRHRIQENSPSGVNIPGCPISSTSAEFFAAERMFFINRGGPQCIRMRDKDTGDWIPGCFTWVESKGFSKHVPDFTPTFRGVCIDGDHEPGEPLKDAKNALKHLAPSGVIIFHDAIGRPVREAVTFLLDQGFKARLYVTPHMVMTCWRGEFDIPTHTPDPRGDWAPHLREMKKDFDMGRLS